MSEIFYREREILHQGTPRDPKSELRPSMPKKFKRR